MPPGRKLDVRSLELDNEEGRGTLTVHVERRSDFKGDVAALSQGTLLFDPRGQAHHLQLANPAPAEPSAFPGDVGFPVIELPVPSGQPTRLMRFGNNFLQAGAFVQVVDFVPPTPDGEQGLLRAFCDTEGDYEELRRFADEPHRKRAVVNGRKRAVVCPPDRRRCTRRAALSQGGDVRLRWRREN